MVERRRNARFSPPAYRIRLRSHNFGMVIGQVANMSVGGVFVNGIPSSDFQLGMLLEAEIIGKDWDRDLPPLTMRVCRIESRGIALQFCGLD